MSALQLEIPDEVVSSLRIPPGEVEEQLRRELAIALYCRRVLSVGGARRLAQMSRRDFHDLLGRRGVARHYSEEELAEDLSYARGDR